MTSKGQLEKDLADAKQEIYTLKNQLVECSQNVRDKNREIAVALKPQPLPHAARVATLAVVFILEQHAEVMATDVGAGVAAYQRAVQRAGDLRRLAEIPWEHRDAADELDQDARALYNELTT